MQEKSEGDYKFTELMRSQGSHRQEKSPRIIEPMKSHGSHTAIEVSREYRANEVRRESQGKRSLQGL